MNVVTTPDIEALSARSRDEEMRLLAALDRVSTAMQANERVRNDLQIETGYDRSHEDAATATGSAVEAAQSRATNTLAEPRYNNAH